MPATDLGFADVGERLRALCRRCNTLTALHAGSIWLASVLLTFALRIGFGPLVFSELPLGIALLLCTGGAAGALYYVHRSWLTPTQAAAWVDHQAKLDERLTTLNAFSQLTTKSPLLPLLLKQALDLGESWRPQRIVPRPYPRSAYLVILSLLFLGASPLFSPEVPEMPPPAASPEEQKAAEPKKDPAMAKPVLESLQLAAAGKGGDSGQGAGSQAASAKAAASNGAKRAAGSGPDSQGAPTGNKPAADAEAAATLDATSDKLREAAVSGSNPKEIQAGAASTAARGGGKGDDRGGDDQKEAHAKQASDGAASKPPDDPPANEKQAQLMQPNRRDSEPPADTKSAGAPKDKPKDPTGSNKGSAPGAGPGSEHADLLTVTGGAAAPDAAAAGVFKLTLNSFLNAVEEKQQRKRSPKRDNGAPSGANGAPPPLSDHQVDDDALRKASIPPEYEEIVKRVYSRD